MSIEKLSILIQRVLPAVYDDSLSYVELLGKVVAKINELTDATNEYLSQDLQTYVEQIMNEWKTAGTFDTLIESILVPDLDAVEGAVSQLQTDLSDLGGTVTNGLSDVDDAILDVANDLLTFGINAKNPPSGYTACVGDGVADDTAALNALLQNFDTVLLPAGEYRVTDSIVINRDGQSLIGLVPNIRAYGDSVKIMYNGSAAQTKAVLLVSKNAVGSNPTAALSDVVVKNLYISAGLLAGFGIYSTWLTNDSLIENIVIWNATEYNGYFARSWFATYRRIYSMTCQNVGLAFGMPLFLSDNTAYSWDNDEQMNACTIFDIRSHSAGKNYHTDNPATYDHDDANMRRKGYGLGFGKGHGLFVYNWQSERSGGAGVYIYPSIGAVKLFDKGYIENAEFNAGTDAAEIAGMILEHDSSSGGQYTISNVSFSYGTGGGIYYKGSAAQRKVKLINCHTPRHLTSLDGLSVTTLYATVLKDNVAYHCGYVNTNERYGLRVAKATVNTGTSWEINITPLCADGSMVIRLKQESAATPQGSVIITFDDDTTTSFSYPDLSNQEWQTIANIRPNIKKLSKGGVGSDAANVSFVVTNYPRTTGQ
jgi:hypothetical protein